MLVSDNLIMRLCSDVQLRSSDSLELKKKVIIAPWK